MERETVGNFIYELRKESGMTQKELAEKIGVSDKAISKWETGKGLPDTAYFEPLCEVFDITVNDLITGKRLSPAEYSVKAEENMMKLMNENSKNGKKQLIVGGILIVLGVIYLLLCTGGVGIFNDLVWFVDLPSLIMVAIITAGCTFISGARGKKQIVSFAAKIIMPVSLVIFLFTAIILLGHIESINLIGPNLAVAILSPFYAIVAYIILKILENRYE